MKRVGVVAHPARPEAAKLARWAAEFLSERDVEVSVPRDGADGVGLGNHAVEAEGFGEGLDFAVSLGGDGTMLRAVDLVYSRQVPVLGVNLGQFGFLTEVEPPDLEGALERVLAGDYDIEERMVVHLDVESDGAAGGSWWALNECLIEKAHSGRLVRLAVSVDGAFFTTYAADGLIVATPTGSTAYSFSARGPIVSPGLSCLVVTPVSPHMLFDRSLVLRPDEELRFEVVDEPDVELTVDGRTLGTLTAGDTVTCRSGSWPARLIVFSKRNFHEVLKAKFQLPDR